MIVEGKAIAYLILISNTRILSSHLAPMSNKERKWFYISMRYRPEIGTKSVSCLIFIKSEWLVKYSSVPERLQMIKVLIGALEAVLQIDDTTFGKRTEPIGADINHHFVFGYF